MPNGYNAVSVDRVDCLLLLVGCDGTDILLIVGVLGVGAVVKSIRRFSAPFVRVSYPPQTPFVAALYSPLVVVVLIVVILLQG